MVLLLSEWTVLFIVYNKRVTELLDTQVWGITWFNSFTFYLASHEAVKESYPTFGYGSEDTVEAVSYESSNQQKQAETQPKQDNCLFRNNPTTE